MRVAGDEDKVRKITVLLEHGGTMLAQHHTCGAPLFKYQGRLVCPVCDGPLGAGGGQQETAAGPRPMAAPKPSAGPAEVPFSGAQARQLCALLLDYSQRAAQRLTGGEDPEADEHLMEAIEAALRCTAMLEGGK